MTKNKKKLSPELIEKIKASTGERVVDVAKRLGVSLGSVSKYRPCSRKHLTDDEFHLIVSEWLLRIPGRETAQRLNVGVRTIYKIRRQAFDKLADQMRINHSRDRSEELHPAQD